MFLLRGTEQVSLRFDQSMEADWPDLIAAVSFKDQLLGELVDAGRRHEFENVVRRSLFVAGRPLDDAERARCDAPGQDVVAHVIQGWPMVLCQIMSR